MYSGESMLNKLITYMQAYIPYESSEDSSNQPDGRMESPNILLDPTKPP